MPGKGAHASARIFAALFTEHRVLCDLLSAETSVLEHNVSEEVALRYKRGALSRPSTNWLADREHAAELDAVPGVIHHHHRPGRSDVDTSHPSPAMAAVYRDEQALARVKLAVASGWFAGVAVESDDDGVRG